VVTVYMTPQRSGFIIDADGHIVTNNHAIAEGGEIHILFHDGDVKWLNPLAPTRQHALLQSMPPSAN
jgi:hypothetical protein